METSPKEILKKHLNNGIQILLDYSFFLGKVKEEVAPELAARLILLTRATSEYDRNAGRVLNIETDDDAVLDLKIEELKTKLQHRLETINTLSGSGLYEQIKEANPEFAQKFDELQIKTVNTIAGLHSEELVSALNLYLFEVPDREAQLDKQKTEELQEMLDY